MEMVYLIACLAITMGAYYAAYLFARKDEVFYAICFFLVASGAFWGAASMVNTPKAVSPPALAQPSPK